MYKESVVPRIGSNVLALMIQLFTLSLALEKNHNLFQRRFRFLFTIQEEQGQRRGNFQLLNIKVKMADHV